MTTPLVGASGVEKSTEAGNLKAHSATHGPGEIAQRRADSIRLQALGQIGGTRRALGVML